jgi:hypothetical protein
MLKCDKYFMDRIRKRLADAIKNKGFDYKELSLRLGRNHAYLNQFINKNVPKTLNEIDRRKLSEWLGIGEEEIGAPFVEGNQLQTQTITHDKPEGTLGRFQQVRIIGSVKASSWQDVTEQMTTEEAQYVPSASDYPADWQYAFTVDGPSVNKTARDGDILVCVDLIKSGVDVTENDLVIVERTRFHGAMLERTAKRVRKAIAGPELWPDSDDPEHQDPIPLSAAEDDEIRVSAKVIWVLRKP